MRTTIIVGAIALIFISGGFMLGKLSNASKFGFVLQEGMKRHFKWSSEDIINLIRSEEFDVVAIPKGFTVTLTEQEKV